jgi:hypothetical protein
MTTYILESMTTYIVKGQTPAGGRSGVRSGPASQPTRRDAFGSHPCERRPGSVVIRIPRVHDLHRLVHAQPKPNR